MMSIGGTPQPTLAAVRQALPGWRVRHMHSEWRASYSEAFTVIAADAEALVQDCWALETTLFLLCRSPETRPHTFG